MGLLNRAKASLSNAGNYTSQKADEASYNSKINDQKRTKEKALADVGQIMFDLYKTGVTEINDEVKALFDKSIECDKEVERLEQEKEEMIAKYENERQERRDRVAEENEREKAEKAAAKAAQKEKEKE